MDSLSLLRFYDAVGIGEAYGDKPFNFLDYSMPKILSPVSGVDDAGTPRAVMAVADLVAEAEQAVAACASVSELDKAVLDMRDLPLAKLAMNAVVGRGSVSPEILAITEIPTSWDDRTGEFMRDADGDMLSRILGAMKRSVETDAYAMPAIPFRPAGGRMPTEEEAMIMRPFLLRRIELLKPSLIVSFGALAVRMLFGDMRPITEMQGKMLDLGGIPVMPVFSVPFMMSNADAKRETWNSIKSL